MCSVLHKCKVSTVSYLDTNDSVNRGQTEMLDFAGDKFEQLSSA